MDEIENARRAHLSIPGPLADSPLLLNATHSYQNPILHKTELPSTPANPEVFAKLQAMIRDREAESHEPDSMGSISLAQMKMQATRAWVGSVEQEHDMWYRVRHHDLLQSLLARGSLPFHWPERVENPGLSEPQTLSSAYKEARDLGFAIPDQFLEAGERSSYGEKEAFYAATEFAENRCTFDLSDTDHAKMREVRQLSSSFLIPNWRPGAAPFVADQLWIVQGPEETVRFLVLEIDGEHHMNQRNQKRDEQRDAYFNDLGYEVYRVAGWWARIDPFRVIGDFLSQALGMTSFKSAFDFAPGDIREYVCFACNKPMVRWDDNWISADYRYLHEADLSEEDSERVFVHRQCQCEG